MRRRVELTPSAEHDAAHMSRGDREALGQALDLLAEDAVPPGIKRLSYRDHRRVLPVGSVRAILRLEYRTGSISIVRILPRKPTG